MRIPNTPIIDVLVVGAGPAGLTLACDLARRGKTIRIIDKLKERIPISVLLSGLSLLFAYLISIPLGIYSSIRQYSIGDRLTTVGLFTLYSLRAAHLESASSGTTTQAATRSPPMATIAARPTRRSSSDGFTITHTPSARSAR